MRSRTAGPLAAGTGNTVSSVARLRSDVDRKAVEDIVKNRGIAVDAAAGVTDVAETSIAPLEMAQAPKDLSRILAVLSGAAFCLLLTACINVLNLELTGVVGRSLLLTA